MTGAEVLQLPLPDLCAHGCGQRAAIEVVDLPDLAQGDHLATLVSALAHLDARTVQRLCRRCAGSPDGWDSYTTLHLEHEVGERAAA